MRYWHAHLRLLLAVVIGTAVFAALRWTWDGTAVTRSLLAWNAGVLSYLVLAGTTMARSNQAHMRWRASLEDEGRWLALALVLLGVVASLVAIALQLTVARGLPPAERFSHIGLAGLTVLTSWAVMQTMFAIRYAHEFYRGKVAVGGLEFPGNQEPDYLDFLYVACIIGTSGQTADVAFSSRLMRRFGMVHCVLAFFFNTTILALTINVAASLV
ncbi:MAG: DUF1345 domain-containing protein [Burkholderiales bacterium]